MRDLIVKLLDSMTDDELRCVWWLLAKWRKP